MKKLTAVKNFLIRHFPIVVIAVVWLILLITNYTPGTYLLGWDNLQTELNPGLAVKRAFFASWQEYQSLGLPAGMGHAADLIRSVVLWVASFIVPQNMLRYGFHMSMVLVGALGMYKLLDLSGFNKDTSVQSHSASSGQAGQDKRGFALMGALAYVLNYNVIQMMFLPYESFSIFMGMLPFEIWAFLKVIDNGHRDKKNWLIFFLVFILSTSQAQALQLFVVLMVALFLLTIGLAIQTMSFPRKRESRKEWIADQVRDDKKKAGIFFTILKRAFLAAVVIIAINSFWLFPQFYFLKTSASVVQTAKINQLSTEDVFYRNKDKGDVKDFLTNTGFFNDGVDHNQQPLFASWISYRENIAVNILIYAIAAISILGIFTRSKYKWPFVLLYILVVILLLNNTFPLDVLNALIRKSSFINQIFRSPFTKFSILYALVASYFFASGSYFLTQNLRTIILKNLNTKKYKSYLSLNIFVAFLVSLILLQALPAFTGNYISPQLRLSIPKSYFNLFEYFKTVDKNKRVALLPEYTHWGWFFNNWGYDGSGFIWYGIEQPILSRNFDMWSTKSEGYYWEIKAALEKEDLQGVENVLEKYGVDYLIFDHSVAPVVSSSKSIQNSRVESLLQKSQKIKISKKWDFITLYEVNHDKKIQDFVWSTGKLPNIGPEIGLTNEDSAYKDYSNYQTNPSDKYQMYYPFLDLTTQTTLKDKTWDMEETDTDWIFTRKLPFNTKIHDLQSNEEISLYEDGTAVNYTLPYTVSINDSIVSMKFPKIIVNYFKPSSSTLRYCVNKTGDIPSSQIGNSLTINASSGDYICTNYEASYLDQKYGYIIKIESKNISGQRPFFYALDKTKDQSYIEDRLTKDTQYYVLGNRYASGVGYSFAFQANSYKTIPSVNELKGLSVYLMPYDALKTIGIRMSNTKKAETNDDFEAKKVSYYKYLVDLGKPGQGSTIVLNQAYHEGWHGYKIKNQKSKIKNYIYQTFPYVFGEEIKNHVIVNNWENGWILQDLHSASSGQAKSNLKTQIVIVYLPQYLEYMGFGLVIITLAVTIKRYGFDKKRSV